MCRFVEQKTCVPTFPVKSGVPKYGTPAKKPLCTKVPAPSTPAVLVTPSSSDWRVNGPPPAASSAPIRSLAARDEQVLGRLLLWRDCSSAFEQSGANSLGIGVERSANATLAKLAASAALMFVTCLLCEKMPFDVNAEM